MRKKNYNKKWLLMIAVFLMICIVSIFVMISGNKVKYEAAGKADCGFLTLKNQTRRQLDLITF